MSTDGEAFSAYAETIALLTAIVTIAAATWMVMMPGAGAALTIPAEQPAAIAQFDLVPGGEAVQPHLDGPSATAVLVDPALNLPPLSA